MITKQYQEKKLTPRACVHVLISTVKGWESRSYVIWLHTWQPSCFSFAGITIWSQLSHRTNVIVLSSIKKDCIWFITVSWSQRNLFSAWSKWKVMVTRIDGLKNQSCNPHWAIYPRIWCITMQVIAPWAMIEILVCRCAGWQKTLSYKC